VNKANTHAQKRVKAQKHSHTHNDSDRNHFKKAEQLIPKPKGSAGKSAPKGYILQDAMGLQDDKRCYNILAVRS
jgi:hypothetical protein